MIYIILFGLIKNKEWVVGNREWGVRNWKCVKGTW